MKSFNVSDIPPLPYHFETLIEVKHMREFLKKFWHYSLYISLIYIIAIYFLRSYMNSRPAFNLKHVSIYWNAILAIYSICSTLRGFPAYYFMFTHYPFYYVACDKSLLENSPQFIFWGTLFLFSKVWELGDTLLIILRKQNLKFLHWYHHVVTLIMLWYSALREATHGALLGYTNVVVHSLMYTYFTVKSMDVKIPRKIAMFITAVQTVQMLFGVLLSIWVYWLIENKYECDVPNDALTFAFLTYVTYLCLFSYMFYDYYIRPNFSHKKTD